MLTSFILIALVCSLVLSQALSASFTGYTPIVTTDASPEGGGEGEKVEEMKEAVIKLVVREAGQRERPVVILNFNLTQKLRKLKLLMKLNLNLLQNLM